MLPFAGINSEHVTSEKLDESIPGYPQEPGIPKSRVVCSNKALAQKCLVRAATLHAHETKETGTIPNPCDVVPIGPHVPSGELPPPHLQMGGRLTPPLAGFGARAPKRGLWVWRGGPAPH